MKATLYRICFGIIKGRIMLKQHYTPLLLNTRSIMKSTLRWKIAQEMTHTLQTYNSVRDTIGNAWQCLAMPSVALLYAYAAKSCTGQRDQKQLHAENA